MQIARYIVNRFTGTTLSGQEKDTLFPEIGTSSNPLADRRAAFSFANSLISLLLEMESTGETTHKSEYGIDNPNEDKFEVSVYVVYVDDEGNEVPEIVYGIPLSASLLENLEEEAECYADNEYDTGGALMHLNASILNVGYKVVLNDVYSLYNDELVRLEEEAEK